MKKIFSFLLFSSLFLTQSYSQNSSFKQTLSDTIYFPFEIGNKWYYQDSQSNYPHPYHLIRSISDTASDGTRIVTIKKIYADSVGYDNERWKFSKGRFLIIPSYGSPRGPMFDSRITEDTVIVPGPPLFISYEILNINIFENNYYSQKYNWSYVSHGGGGYQYETANNIGITFLFEWGYTYPASRDTFKLKAVLLNGVLLGDTTFIDEPDTIEVPKLPKDFYLSQNCPNPFNSLTEISYKLSVTSNVTLKVYDILGREVATLVNVE